MGFLDSVTTLTGKLPNGGTAFRFGVVLAFAGAVIACKGGLDGPSPDTKVFEGEQGWALAIPKEPAEAGVQTRIWILGEFEERISLRIEYRAIDPSGSDAQVGISWGTSASGRWAEFRGRQPPLKAGEFELLLFSSGVDGVLLVSGFLTVK